MNNEIMFVLFVNFSVKVFSLNKVILDQLFIMWFCDYLFEFPDCI